MKLRHLEWLVEEPVPDLEWRIEWPVPHRNEPIIYELLPYSPAQADVIIQQLFALAELDLEQAGDDPARAQRVGEAFRFIVAAARGQQAWLDYDAFERQIAKAPWRDRLRDLRHDRRQFATAISNKDAVSLSAGHSSARRPAPVPGGFITCAIIPRSCGGQSTGRWRPTCCNVTWDDRIASNAFTLSSA